MRLTLVPWILITLTMVVGTAFASAATIDFRSPSEAAMTMDPVIQGDDASGMRQYMDLPPEQGGVGNGDGQVTQNEVDALEDFLKSFFENFDEGGTPTGTLTMDDLPPSDFRLEAFDVRDATGPVASEDPITMHVSFVFEFNVTAGDRHTLKIEAEEDSGNQDDEEEDGSNPYGDFEITEATLKAPKGYIIESADGLPPGASVSGDKKSVRYDGLPEPTAGEDTVIVFARGGGGAPGVGAVAVVVVGVLVAGFVAARRR